MTPFAASLSPLLVVAIVVVVVIVAVIGVVRSFRRRKRVTGEDAAWAAAHGLTVVRSFPQFSGAWAPHPFDTDGDAADGVTGTWNGHTIAAFAYSVTTYSGTRASAGMSGTGQTSQTRNYGVATTGIAATLPPFQLHAKRSGVAGALGTLGDKVAHGGRDVAVGRAPIDSAYHVRCDDAAGITALLTGPFGDALIQNNALGYSVGVAGTTLYVFTEVASSAIEPRDFELLITLVTALASAVAAGPTQPATPARA